MTASRRVAAAVFALMLCALNAPALEISLEENKAERGNIGFIELQKVFKLYPETHKAKRSYAEIVGQAEEQIELKKADLFSLRADLAKAKLELELFAKTPPPAPPPVAISTATLTPAMTDAEPVDPEQVDAGVEVSSPAAATPLEIPSELQGLPGMSTSLNEKRQSPPEADSDELIISIPGLSDEPAAQEPEQESPGNAHERRRLELELAVSRLASQAAEAEADFAAYQQQMEENLLDIESRRSEILLGKIYQAVREAAREAGVSVVVDKSQILYGQGSVDLTDLVIRRLEASSK